MHSVAQDINIRADYACLHVRSCARSLCHPACGDCSRGSSAVLVPAMFVSAAPSSQDDEHSRLMSLRHEMHDGDGTTFGHRAQGRIARQTAWDCSTFGKNLERPAEVSALPAIVRHVFLRLGYSFAFAEAFTKVSIMSKVFVIPSRHRYKDLYPGRKLVL